MLDWLNGLAGPQYTRAVLWTFAALLLLVVVLLAIRLFRGMTAGTYVVGGRARKTRLSVMDATAVDSHRRLVLVRRDDIEHLLLIGGPTDVVVERDIRRVAPRRPVLTGDAPAAAQPVPASPPSSTEGRKTQRPAGTNPPAGSDPAPAAKFTPSYVPAKAPAPVRTAPAAASDPFDDALLNELEVSLEEGSSGTGAKSLDDEMAKLLGELSVHKR
jgi:hypothetical protein